MQTEDRIREMGTAASTIGLLAPEIVKEAAGRLTDALADDLPEDDYDEALALYLKAAGNDLGARSGDL